MLNVSCKKDNDNDIDSKLRMLDSNDYFPLHIGNSWSLDFIPERTISKVENLDGKDYYRLTSEYDTVFYRKSSDGKVYSRTKTTNEILKFDLNANVGDTWTYKSDKSNYTWNVTLTSKSEAVELNSYTFHNCYRFYFDVPQLADEELIILLAPGVGFVEEVYLGGTSDRKILKQVKISGIEIQF